MGAIKTIRCSNAEDFISALGQNNELWKEGGRRFWVFRGHADDRMYKLVPSSLRTIPYEAILGYTHKPRKGIQKTNRMQIQAEFERLHEFYWLIDAQGLNIPIDGNLLRTPTAFKRLHREISKAWPCDSLLPLLALAQHYGVPTRLLDWSENPLAAALFAALDVIDLVRKKKSKTSKSKKKLAVWALNFDWVIHKAFPDDGKTKMAVYVVTAARASNPNLHAQGGVFTTEILTNKEQKGRRRPNVIPVDKVVASKWESFKPSHGKPVMAHLTLPWDETPKLLRLLNREGMNRAVLYPGYKGIADSFKDMAEWDQEERALYWVRQ